MSATSKIDNSSSPLIFRTDEVVALLGFSAKSSLHRLIREHHFPKPIKLGGKLKGYMADEVYAWIEARKAERDYAA